MKKSAVITLHLVYWTGYVLLLGFCYSLLRLAPFGGPAPGVLFIKMVIGFAIVPGLAGFYSSYTFLFSKYLKQKRILALCGYGILVCLACGLLGELFLTILIGGAGDNKGDLIFPNYEPSEIAVALFLTTIVALANSIVGLVTKGFITSYGDIKLKEDLNKKNYEMELALVKSQINPHFLFNTINNIDVLISKDPSAASAYLNKLSDIMRFMLYETKTEEILLDKELTYIEKYIDLQKIRTSNTEYVNYNVTGIPDHVMIAPMLFIPFIENAFKYTENKRIENAISICIAIDKDKVTFECENNYSNISKVKPDQSGLGNELIQKRLMLLYPGKHMLEVIDKNSIYKVKLVLYNNAD